MNKICYFRLDNNSTTEYIKWFKGAVIAVNNYSNGEIEIQSGFLGGGKGEGSIKSITQAIIATEFGSIISIDVKSDWYEINFIYHPEKVIMPDPNSIKNPLRKSYYIYDEYNSDDLESGTFHAEKAKLISYKNE